MAAYASAFAPIACAATAFSLTCRRLAVRSALLARRSSVVVAYRGGSTPCSIHMIMFRVNGAGRQKDGGLSPFSPLLHPTPTCCRSCGNSDRSASRYWASLNASTRWARSHDRASRSQRCRLSACSTGRLNLPSRSSLGVVPATPPTSSCRSSRDTMSE